MTATIKNQIQIKLDRKETNILWRVYYIVTCAKSYTRCFSCVLSLILFVMTSWWDK